MNFATEDELSEVTLLTILAATKRYAVGTAYRRGGFGYLRRTVPGWNHAAKGVPFVVLADLDAAECPARLIEDWLPGQRHPNLLFRIAVREIESWILADPIHLSEFLKVQKVHAFSNTDSIPDPKAAIVKLADGSRSRTIRECIVPRRGSTAKQGPDYNGCLSRFVRDHWDHDIARRNSPSLRRALERLSSFEPTWR